MRLRVVVILVGLSMVGCVSEPPARPLPEVVGADYDVLFDATRRVLQDRRFTIYAALRDRGTIVTDFKRAEPFPEVWAKDAQTSYDTLEDFGYIVRRKATAVIGKGPDGRYAVKLTVIRERQNYSPPRPEYSSSYDIYYREKGRFQEAVAYGESITWTRLPNDVFLEGKLLEEIQRRAGRPAVAKK